MNKVFQHSNVKLCLISLFINNKPETCAADSKTKRGKKKKSNYSEISTHISHETLFFFFLPEAQKPNKHKSTANPCKEG